MVKHSILTAACLMALAMPALLEAQAFPEDVPESKFRFGPIGFTPRIALKNIGVDTNPLNQSGTPERDFTVTLEPGVDSLLRIGRGRLIGKTGVEWHYFNRLPGERSINLNQDVRAEVELNRVMPFVAGSYVRTRRRPNLEIDARVQQRGTVVAAGTGLRLGTRLRLDLEGRRSTLTFGEGAHGDEVIAQALDREVELATALARVALSRQSTFTLRSEVQRDQFRSSVLRNSRSATLLPGLELKPSALVSGRVSVGYRRFDARDARVPDYAGVVAKVDVKYVLREATKWGLEAERNIDYSVEFSQPYFVLTGGTLSVMQILGGDWYATGRLGRSRLSYRDRLDTPASAGATGRTDHVDTYGTGIGRLLGTDLRVGVEVMRVRRTSDSAGREYDGFRFGGSISYGY